MTAFLMLFMSLLFMAGSLAALMVVILGYCIALEMNDVDPDKGWAFRGAIALMILGCCLIAWLFVTVCIPFIDLILAMMGLTGL